MIQGCRDRGFRALFAVARQIDDHPRKVHDAESAAVSAHHGQTPEQGVHRGPQNGPSQLVLLGERQPPARPLESRGRNRRR